MKSKPSDELTSPAIENRKAMIRKLDRRIRAQERLVESITDPEQKELSLLELERMRIHRRTLYNTNLREIEVLQIRKRTPPALAAMLYSN